MKTELNPEWKCDRCGDVRHSQFLPHLWDIYTFRLKWSITSHEIHLCSSCTYRRSTTTKSLLDWLDKFFKR